VENATQPWRRDGNRFSGYRKAEGAVPPAAVQLT